jgi:DNA-directed RNA polymerase specialized sigma24 family protein
MRDVLVDHARRKKAIKRPDPSQRVDLPDSQFIEIAHPSFSDEILAVDEALKRLATHDQASADVAELHYFVGMNMKATADALDISVDQARGLWAYAKAWLRGEISKDREI